MRVRTSRSLVNFDAWRVFDRSLAKGSGKHPAVAKLQIAPAALVRAFGMPDDGEAGFDGTGQYSFCLLYTSDAADE